MSTITIEYDSSVKTAAGWRHVAIQAEAESVSPAMLKVVKVIQIDHESPAYGQSRTGARRQEFNGVYFAEKQVGAKKRLSSVRVVNEVAA